MTDNNTLSGALRELVAKWRERGERLGVQEFTGNADLLFANELEAALAAQPDAVGEWVLVPREATEAMMDAGYLHTALVDLPRDLYAAMVAAAPTPAAPVRYRIQRNEDAGYVGFSLEPDENGPLCKFSEMKNAAWMGAVAAAPTPAAVGQGEGDRYMYECPNCPTGLDSNQPEPPPCLRCGARMEPDNTAKPDTHPAAVREAGAELANRVEGVASFLIGYGDTAELAAARLRDALRSYDAALARDGVREVDDAMVRRACNAYFDALPSSGGESANEEAMRAAIEAALARDGVEGGA